MKFQHFFKVHQISSNLQNLFESSSETSMWNLSQFREVNPTVPALYSWNFNIYSKFTSSNLQNILESSSETCMWNLSLFREVNLFHRKMPTVPALWNIMKFQHFFKVHQLSSNLQNILESSSETCMWNLSLFREVKFFHRKMLTLPALQNIMKFQDFIKVHQISSNLQNHHQKHACEIWAHKEKLTYFKEKCRQCRS